MNCSPRRTKRPYPSGSPPCACFPNATKNSTNVVDIYTYNSVEPAKRRPGWSTTQDGRYILFMRSPCRLYCLLASARPRARLLLAHADRSSLPTMAPPDIAPRTSRPRSTPAQSSSQGLLGKGGCHTQFAEGNQTLCHTASRTHRARPSATH
jgi:hypothetical protein